MRLASPRLIAVPIIALTLAVTACGGSKVAYSPVPGDPVDLAVPGTGEALAPAATATPTVTATETPDPDTAQATPTPDAGTGGGTQAPTGEDSATNDQPPPGGSDAQQYEDFCAANPGAC